MADYSDIFDLLKEAIKQGKITTDERTSVKELISSDNTIVLDLIMDYKESKNKDAFITGIKEYLKLFEEEDTDDNKYLDSMTSPGDNFLKNVRKEKMKHQNDKKDEDFVVDECDFGQSPKIAL